ncbi:Zinc transporter ZIP9 [Strongyloides ratti]|uniref:Zinc transporter ZIP9 n=1 Tax=Strongyloides ratti TaxID=34506 RepID=A0A090KYT3_STRRB|nr:Zinc transporter ZIP9 [Strongyloides ratti]CEF61047.1 Zinc transporter ZIP9 [Strongyloides ratti]
MLEGETILLVFSCSMFIGSYVAGLIPLAFTLNENKVKLLSIFGAGLLIGTALSVIIPEGIVALYSFPEEHANIYVNTLNDTKLLKKEKNINDINMHAVKKREIFHQEISLNEDRNYEKKISHRHKNSHSQEIGLSLIIGFIFMLVVDHITHFASTVNSSLSRNKITATVGLVVHAAADGIALGSAAASPKNDIQFIIFFAIMLHKAPAAFGLVSFLMLEGLEKFRIKKHLMIFSLAAPITAVITYQILLFVSSESLNYSSTTGILMLFSAGTFLYVATVHVLPELQANKKGTGELIVVSSMTPGHSHSSNSPQFSTKELILLIIGAIFPSFLNSGHSH